MKLYYHKTDGGAEYYSTTYIECPNGHKEGTFEGVVMRINGDEIEIFTDRLNEQHINLVLHAAKPWLGRCWGETTK